MIYKYCDLNGFDIIKNLRLKISTLPKVNDPFDWDISAEPEDVDCMKREIWTDIGLVKTWEDNFSKFGSPVNFGNPEAFFAKILEYQMRDIFRAIMINEKRMETKFGFISFSKNPDIIPMWGLYAEKHTGIVVGIDESLLPIDPKEIIELNNRRLKSAGSYKGLKVPDTR
jgi:hypothetical protein